MIEHIQRGRQTKPPRILLYGTEGIGKSTFASQAPLPIFIQTEDGLDSIDADRFPLATKYEQVLVALDELNVKNHDYETVVIDSLDWLEQLIWQYLCEQHNVDSIEKVDGGYGRGYIQSLNCWREIIDKLNHLRLNHSMVVLLIAHSKIERFEDPEASPYDRYSPRLHKHAAALVCEWCDAVLFATRKMRTQTENVGFGRKRTLAHAVGKEGGERIMRCVGGPTCVAKNRFSLPEELPLSWSVLMAALTNHHQARG